MRSQKDDDDDDDADHSADGVIHVIQGERRIDGIKRGEKRTIRIIIIFFDYIRSTLLFTALSIPFALFLPQHNTDVSVLL